jgi:hypothetical protein
MDRIKGVKDSIEVVRKFNFAPAGAAFDSAFQKY